MNANNSVYTQNTVNLRAVIALNKVLKYRLNVLNQKSHKLHYNIYLMT